MISKLIRWFLKTKRKLKPLFLTHPETRRWYRPLRRAGIVTLEDLLKVPDPQALIDIKGIGPYGRDLLMGIWLKERPTV